MDHTYWHKQTAEQPLFPDLLWSRPENRAHAGKLLIIGGNEHGFSAAAEAYGQAVKAGVGTARVLLPDGLRKTVGRVFEAGEYAPSTPSGSFSQQALAEFLAMSQWADATLLAGDLGRNSETAILLESFTRKYSEPLALADDAVDYFISLPEAVLDRPKTLLTLSFPQLQKLATGIHYAKALTSSMDFLHLINALHELTEKHQASLIVKHLETIFVAVNGQVSTTKLATNSDNWQIKTATSATVWWLQNPSKTFEATTSSLF